MAKCVAIDPGGSTAFRRICFVPSRAGEMSISSAPDTPAASTNLKRDAGKTEYSLCDGVQLEGVNTSLVFIWEN